MLRRLTRWLGNSLIILGIIILGGTGALYGYGQYEQARLAQQVTAPPPAARNGGAAPATGPSLAIAPSATVSASANLDPPGPTGAAHASPAPTARPILPAVRVTAAAIKLDAKVEEAPIINGQWAIPKFAAGHLEGTAEPLQGGNVVLAGHVESISSGDVFHDIAQLHPGDVIKLYTKAAVVSYRVGKVEVVSNDNTKPLAPTSHEELTLITCAGSWLPLQHDYSQRTVVVADRIG